MVWCGQKTVAHHTVLHSFEGNACRHRFAVASLKLLDIHSSASLAGKKRNLLKSKRETPNREILRSNVHVPGTEKLIIDDQQPILLAALRYAARRIASRIRVCVGFERPELGNRALLQTNTFLVP